jgi:exopolysaccharide biosynthesis protein
LNRKHSKRRHAYRTPFTFLLFLGMCTAALCICRTQHACGLHNIHVVRIPLNSGMQVRPVIARQNALKSETFPEMIARTRPYAAINGTFYNESMRPLGDVLIRGRLANRGHYHSALAVRADGRVEFLHRGRNNFDWSGYKWGLASGPRLVHNGSIALNPNADGFKLKSLDIKGWRSGIGLTSGGVLLLVTAKRPLTLEEFAGVMVKLGAKEAINLDGGSACALYKNGRYIAVPSAPMTNILAVYDTRQNPS